LGAALMALVLATADRLDGEPVAVEASSPQVAVPSPTAFDSVSDATAEKLDRLGGRMSDLESQVALLAAISEARYEIAAASENGNNEDLVEIGSRLYAVEVQLRNLALEMDELLSDGDSPGVTLPPDARSELLRMRAQLDELVPEVAGAVDQLRAARGAGDR
jgi:hypothetical protein